MHSWLNLRSLLLLVVGRGPRLIVYLIAAIWCARHAAKQRRRTLLVGAAIAVDFVWSMCFLFAGQLITGAAHRLLSPMELATFAVSFIHSLPHALSLFLLVYAVFYGDEHRDYQDFPDDDPNS